MDYYYLHYLYLRVTFCSSMGQCSVNHRCKHSQSLLDIHSRHFMRVLRYAYWLFCALWYRCTKKSTTWWVGIIVLFCTETSVSLTYPYALIGSLTSAVISVRLAAVRISLCREPAHVYKHPWLWVVSVLYTRVRAYDYTVFPLCENISVSQGKKK